jgi:hypothetical protein
VVKIGAKVIAHGRQAGMPSAGSPEPVAGRRAGALSRSEAEAIAFAAIKAVSKLREGMAPRPSGNCPLNGHLSAYDRSMTVGGGTSEVQRNIVAQRILGLPRR